MNVFLIAAISVDGFIGRDSQHSADWTSKEDKQLFVRLTKEAKVMIMGSKTYQTIGHGLPDRKSIVYTSRPDRFTEQQGDVEFTDKKPQELLKQLEKAGYKSVAICGGSQIYSMFIDTMMVDDLYLTIEPVVFGTGVPLFANAIEANLSLVDQSMLNEQTVLLHYKVQS